MSPQSNQGGIESNIGGRVYHTCVTTPQSNQGGIERGDGTGDALIDVLPGRNRTKVGLKEGTKQAGDTWEIKPQSNQGGIESYARHRHRSWPWACRNRTKVGLKVRVSLPLRRARPGRNRTKVGLKAQGPGNTTRGPHRPQSNQGGIERALLLRTSLTDTAPQSNQGGIERPLPEDAGNRCGEAAIEPRWD